LRAEASHVVRFLLLCLAWQDFNALASFWARVCGFGFVIDSVIAGVMDGGRLSAPVNVPLPEGLRPSVGGGVSGPGQGSSFAHVGLGGGGNPPFSLAS
jgi:hypothetical protein